MVKSKVNGLASWMFHIIISRTAERLDLPDAVDDFHRSYLLMREMGIPITEEVVSCYSVWFQIGVTSNRLPMHVHQISDLRLYLRLMNDDALGHLQTGRRCNMAALTSTKVVRLFSTMNFQVYDLRLVAMTELYEVARPGKPESLNSSHEVVTHHVPLVQYF